MSHASIRAPRRAARGLTFAVALAALALRADAQPTFLEVSGNVDSQFGYAIAVVGDVDGDGLPDVLIGAPDDDSAGNHAGRVVLLRGVDGALIHAWNGEAAGDFFGSAVSGVGDVDGDGVNDLLVGAYRHSSVALLTGRAYVLSGADFSALHVVDGPLPDSEFGVGVAGVGDVDGDGRPDFAVGAHHSSEVAQQSGSARVFSGADGSLIHTFLGDGFKDDLGHVLSRAGDVNADGVPDIIVGLHDNPEFGQARVYSGSDGAVLHNWTGLTDGDFYGHAVAHAGDLDGDGFADLLVGAALDDVAADDAGRVELRSGATGSVLREWYGDVADDEFGLSLWSAGDFDGDGCVDHIVGIPGDDTNGNNSGAAKIFSGFDGSLIVHLKGLPQGPRRDLVVCGDTDLDGDGRPEVLVGFPYDDVDGVDTGRVRIWSGALPVWSEQGAGLQGALGVPQLVGKGLLAEGTAGRLTLTGAAPAATSVVFGSIGSSPQAFKGGVLHALPFVIRVTANTNASGALTLPWTDLPALPGGSVLVFQAAVLDAGAPSGVALSNAIAGSAR